MIQCMIVAFYVYLAYSKFKTITNPGDISSPITQQLNKFLSLSLSFYSLTDYNNLPGMTLRDWIFFLV